MPDPTPYPLRKLRAAVARLAMKLAPVPDLDDEIGVRCPSPVPINMPGIPESSLHERFTARGVSCPSCKAQL